MPRPSPSLPTHDPREKSIPALMAPAPQAESAWKRFRAGWAGPIALGFLILMLMACLLSLPWTGGRVRDPGAAADSQGSPRYDQQYKTARQLPPSWWWGKSTETGDDTAATRLHATAERMALEKIARDAGPDVTVESLEDKGVKPTPEQVKAAQPSYLMGTDLLGRDLFTRVLMGGSISLLVGVLAAAISVILGTAYGVISGYVGGKTDAVMMRIVDILYSLPTLLLVVLLTVAVDASVNNWVVAKADAAEALQKQHVERETAKLPEADRTPDRLEALEAQAKLAYPPEELSPTTMQAINLGTLLVAIGGVSWLTMARVIRGQVLSLRAQPFMEAARAMGVPVSGLFLRHLLPNLVGPIIVYSTLTVPQAILQESVLSFLGIGVKPPLPTWGNLASDGLVELNPFKSNWWLLVFPCLLLGLTLLALNFVGEGLREALDPKRRRR